MADDRFDRIKVQFEQFLSLVSNVLSEEKEIHLIENKLRRHFNTTSSSYLCSNEFRSLLTRIHRSFDQNDQTTKFFTLLSLFDEELKKHSIKTTIPLEPVSDPVNQSDMEVKQKRKIAKLERRLSNLSRVIQELEEKDLSLDEMRYSDLYLVESKLKKQAYDVYIKLADLKHQPASVERILDQPVVLTDAEIDHPLINQALEDMVNQTRFLPCFNDVFNVIEKTDDQYDLGLSADARKTIAEKAFKIIGMKVKDRRIADFTDIMNSRLPENFDIEHNDPALNNIQLENTLIENEREATIETQRIFEEFSQINPDSAPEIDLESAEESTVESDEEESEPDANGDSPGNRSDRDYDAVDVLPPFSPNSSPSNTSEIIPSEDPVESPPRSSFDDRNPKIVSIASIPVKRTACCSISSTMKRTIPEFFTRTDSDTTEESHPICVTPRRRTTTNDFSTTSKRSAPDNESSTSNKRKEISEVIILD